MSCPVTFPYMYMFCLDHVHQQLLISSSCPITPIINTISLSLLLSLSLPRGQTQYMHTYTHTTFGLRITVDRYACDTALLVQYVYLCLICYMVSIQDELALDVCKLENLDIFPNMQSNLRIKPLFLLCLQAPPFGFTAKNNGATV